MIWKISSEAPCHDYENELCQMFVASSRCIMFLKYFVLTGKPGGISEALSTCSTEPQ